MVSVLRQVKYFLAGLAIIGLVIRCGSWLLPPLEVLSVSTQGELRIDFSAPPTPASIRKAFSMTEDGVDLFGDFEFQGRRVIYRPVNGLREGREYFVLIGTGAEDEKGNSLEREFRYLFRTKEDTEGPLIVSIEPADESVLTLPPETIFLRFSEPVDPQSFGEALRISPSLDHILRWDTEGTAVSIVPLKPLDEGTRYTLSLGTALRDRSRNAMLLPYSATFLYGPDREAPVFSLEWENPSGLRGGLEAESLNRGIAGDAEFSLVFNKKVAVESVPGFLEINPSLGISFSPDLKNRDRGKIGFSQKPEWNKPYTLIVKRGIADTLGNKTPADITFPLLFNRGDFKPPVFVRGFLKNNSVYEAIGGDSNFTTITLDAVSFPTQTEKETELYLVFKVSQEADLLSLASAMGSLSVSVSNGCAYISVKTMDVLNQAAYAGSPVYDPLDSPGAGERFCALLVGIEIENTTHQGMVTITVDGDLADSLGNILGESVSIIWNKQ
ncbi:MAG: Ig-like domain-containing protein [Treponema sp.]|jgi:hypothetical protein|nr:Ig-like domain-containing protein [Treponema sp.]